MSMMRFVDVFMLGLGLLMLILAIREKREAKRIRRDVAAEWRKDAEK